MGRSKAGESVGVVRVQRGGEVRRWQVEQVLLALIRVLGVLMSVPVGMQTLARSAGGLGTRVVQRHTPVTLFAKVTVCMLKVRLCILWSLLSSGTHLIWCSSCSQVTLSPEREARGGG